MYGSCFLSDCTPPFNVHIHFNNNDDSTKDAARNDGIKNAKQSRLGPQKNTIFEALPCMRIAPF